MGEGGSIGKDKAVQILGNKGCVEVRSRISGLQVKSRRWIAPEKGTCERK